MTAFIEGMSQPQLLVILGIMVFLLLFTRSMLRKRLDKTPSSDTSRLQREAQIRGNLDKLFVDIQELSRESIAKLDHRIKILNQLLVEADEKKKTLEALLQQTRGLLISEKVMQTPKISPRPSNPLHEKVYRYADQGMDLTEICTQTGLGKGEVELILGLRQLPEK